MHTMLPPRILSSLPSLLNASLTTTAAVPTSTPHSSTIYCLADQPDPSSQLAPTTFLACREAIKAIPLGDAGLKPVTFGRSPDTGFQVPHAWEAGNCVVEIDVEEEWIMETASFAELFIVAFDMAVTCVISAPHMGGRAMIGSERGLEIFMYGMKDEVDTES